MLPATRGRGLTLIELLVSMEIIAILTATLCPVFATALEKARQVICLSNLNQTPLAHLASTAAHFQEICCNTLTYR